MTTNLLKVVTIGLMLAFFASCANDPGPELSPPREVVPAGPLTTPLVRFQFAVYYLPTPSGDPSAVLKRVMTERPQQFKNVEAINAPPDEPVVHARLRRDVQSGFAPPGMTSLQYFGRGLSREQAEAVQKSEQAFVMEFAYPRKADLGPLLSACRVAENLARATGGLLWDEETREMFTPDEWHTRRVASWTLPLPAISDHTIIHAYQSKEYVRAITLGMSKFGLPDVVVQDFPWSLNRNMGNLINIVCQAIAEGATADKAGSLDLDLRSIRNAKIRNPQVESLKSNATAVARLTLRRGEHEEGDPPGPLIEITFDRYQGSDVHARQEALLSSLFGWEDDVKQVKHDQELLAASRAAREKLPELRKSFADGLRPGEFIQVKAPFATPEGGNEWMWVEIIEWKGDRIKGLLKNEPFNIPSLHGGQVVEVKQQDIFDYIRRLPDGKVEGNTTGEIISRQQKANEKG
jgi:uncharacterized protein YegJ (DUF2314 family)